MGERSRHGAPCMDGTCLCRVDLRAFWWSWPQSLAACGVQHGVVYGSNGRCAISSRSPAPYLRGTAA